MNNPLLRPSSAAAVPPSACPCYGSDDCEATVVASHQGLQDQYRHHEDAHSARGCTRTTACGAGSRARAGSQQVRRSHAATPQELPGWGTDITHCRTFDELRKEARDYIGFIEDLADVPVAMIAVGPSREQTIMRRWESRP